MGREEEIEQSLLAVIDRVDSERNAATVSLCRSYL